MWLAIKVNCSDQVQEKNSSLVILRLSSSRIDKIIHIDRYLSIQNYTCISRLLRLKPLVRDSSVFQATLTVYIDQWFLTLPLFRTPIYCPQCPPKPLTFILTVTGTLIVIIIIISVLMDGFIAP